MQAVTERVLESNGWEEEQPDGAGEGSARARGPPGRGESVCLGRWAKFLITSSGEEICDFKLRTGLQLFAQDSFRVRLGTHSALQGGRPGCLKHVGSPSAEPGGWQGMAILLILASPWEPLFPTAPISPGFTVEKLDFLSQTLNP